MACKTNSSQGQSLEDFKPFFGGDPKGVFLVQAMFNGTNYTDRAGHNSGLMTELLRADNYKNYQNIRSAIDGKVQLPDDVPQDITDVIITTALFHRNIDLSASAGTNLGEAINRISVAMNDWLNQPTSGAQKSAYSLVSRADGEYIDATYKNASSSNANHLLYLFADRAAWDASSNPNSSSLSVGRDRYNTTTISEISRIADCSNTDNLCWGSVLNNNSNAREALKSMNISKTNVNSIQSSIQTSIRNSALNVIASMKQEMLSEYPGIRGTTGGQYSVATVNAFMTPERRQKYLQMLKTNINESVPRAIRGVVTSAFEIPHTDLNNAYAKSFFESVYKAWPNMPADAREFYGQNVSIFAKANSMGLYDSSNDLARKQQLKMDWIRLTPKELDALFARQQPLSSADLSNLRVNFMKNPLSGYADILFGSNLPDVPAGANVWYTQRSGTYSQVSAPPADFLRKLYAASYSNGVTGGNIRVSYTTPSVANYVLSDIESNVENRPKQPFNLNIGKFTAAAINREDAIMTNAQKQTTQSTASVDGDLSVYPLLTAYDMVYGKVWTFDSQKGQYYRTDVNGRKVYYDDDAKGDASTCYATYLSKGNDANCMRVIQCIADGNHKSLNRCLDVIGDGDLWSIAADDVQKVGPDMIKLVLRKFGLKAYEETDSTGAKYKVPMSYEEWKKEIVPTFPQDVQTTILNNARLNSYLRGLIGICRSNPNIINKNNPKIIERDDTPNYIKNLNMRKYKIPAVNSKTQYEFFSDMLRNATKPHNVSQDMYNPITSGSVFPYNPIASGSYSNVMFINPASNMMPAMMGGFYQANIPSLISAGTSFDGADRSGQILKSGSASMFANFLTTIQNAMRDVGLQLHQEDQARILAAITKLESYEEQLARLCAVLVQIVKIARFYGVSLENVDRDHPKTMQKLSEIQTIDDIRDFIRGYARELQKNMVTNMSIQQSASYELMSSVGPRLIDECFGRQQQNNTATTAPSRQLVNF